MANYEDYKRFLSSSPEDTQRYEIVVFKHSKLSRTYYFVIDSSSLTATLEGQEITFEPASIASTNAINSNDLDQSASFTVADVFNELDDELARIPLDDTESLIVGSGIYLDSDLSAPVEYTEYDIKDIVQEKGVFTVNAGAPDLNSDQCGQVFDLDTWPMLRGL